MAKKTLFIEILVSILPITLTIMEIRSNDVFSWVLVAISWFIFVSIISILYVKDKITEIETIKKELLYLRKEIDLNNKMISFYRDIENVKNKKRNN